VFDLSDVAALRILRGCTPRCVVVCCGVLQYVAACCSEGAARKSVLQRVFVCCGVLQCVLLPYILISCHIQCKLACIVNCMMFNRCVCIFLAVVLDCVNHV